MSQDDETFGVVEKPKRVPRKRVVTAVEPQAGETPVPKKRTPRKKVVLHEESATETVPVTPRRIRTPKVESISDRKAPTPIAASKAAVKSTRRQVVVVAVLILLGIGTSAGVGLTDKGSIDVNQTIATRNDKITRGEEQGEIMSVQNTPQLPDGGLVGLGIGGPEASSTQAATSTSTATSSQPTGQIPMTAAEAESAAAASGTQHSSSTGQSQ